MKYPCHVVQDLLPLYYDGVCSEESREVVAHHLSECSSCQSFYQKMCEADHMVLTTPPRDRDMQKAASFQSVRKRLLQKQVIVVLVAFALLALIICSVVGMLKHSIQVFPYEDTISVSMADGSLVGRIQGKQIHQLTIKRVDSPDREQETTYLFFCLSGSTWDTLTTSQEAYFEYVLCPADKGADLVDNIYYYTGDYSDLENMTAAELQTVMNRSVLLWSR